MFFVYDEKYWPGPVCFDATIMFIYECNQDVQLCLSEWIICLCRWWSGGLRQDRHRQEEDAKGEILETGLCCSSPLCFLICSSCLIFVVCAVEPTEWEGRDGSPQGLYRGKPKAGSVPDWSGGFCFFLVLVLHLLRVKWLWPFWGSIWWMSKHHV